jgi:hypothetical protein
MLGFSASTYSAWLEWKKIIAGHLGSVVHTLSLEDDHLGSIKKKNKLRRRIKHSKIGLNWAGLGWAAVYKCIIVGSRPGL